MRFLGFQTSLVLAVLFFGKVATAVVVPEAAGGARVREWYASSIMEVKRWFAAQDLNLTADVQTYVGFYHAERALITALPEALRKVAEARLDKEVVKRVAFFKERSRSLAAEYNRRISAVESAVTTIVKSTKRSEVGWKLSNATSSEGYTRTTFQDKARQTANWQKYRGDAEYVSLKFFSEPKLEKLPDFTEWQGEKIYIAFYVNGRKVETYERKHDELTRDIYKVFGGTPEIRLSFDGSQLLYIGEPLVVKFFVKGYPPTSPNVTTTFTVITPTYQELPATHGIYAQFQSVMREVLLRRRLNSALGRAE